ncbi:Rib/alpha-like domain-containing protein [Streptococcus sp. UMB1203]|uniref:Rib/alpha-like domain-containing protein n=1 Tax=Streptococcus sp. UMB1203 TaxID=3046327 RepID=UPI00255318BB|nr:Rib/alpha-like domain-containing protein [Streptococcus sp. UMB1203]MDK7202820.1 Rib/alpha-like domain-containing protein [Streptococcus sp. UMB1203]
MFKSKGRHVQQSQMEKFTRYSIRKVSFGAASVAVATGLFFLGGGSVQAAEPVINSEPTEVQNSQNLTDKSSEPSKEVTGQASATAKEPDGQNNTSLKESDTDTQANAVETPNVVTEKVTINTASLEDLVAKAESRLSQLTEGKKTKSVIDDAKNLVHKAKELLNDDAKTQAKVDALATQLSSNLSILNSIKLETTEEEKVNKNQDLRNGKEIPGKGESGFREATTANPIIPAKEGPTNNNKLGSGNNPADGVFESAKDQFGDVDFTNSTEKSTKVEKQWSKSILSDKTGKATTQLLTGGITYNWKEKEISNEINGWKITDANGNAGKVTAIKPEAAVADAGREAEYQGKPSKVYDNQGTIKRNYNNPDNPTATNPLGVHAANQNYGNGVNYSGNVGTHNLPKGYYLELGEKGTKLSKEYAVNGNSRLMLSTITGGAYGNMGTAGTGERIKITMYDAVTGEKISSIRDDHTIGEKYEAEHISAPSGDGGNGDGWTEYRAIYEIPKTTSRVKVEIEALDDGTAINNSYLKNTNSTVTDGYFVGAVNLAVGSGTEMTTNVKTNGKEGRFGEDNLYKSKQKGELEFTVNSVGGIRHYGSAETEIEVPEGVDLPENITKPKDWVWFGDTPVAPQNISWDASTRKLKIKYQTSGNNAGVNPYIGIGSNNGKNDGVRKFRLPFTTTDNYRGTATFKVRTYLPNGLSDGKDNQLLNTGDVSNADGKYHPVVNGLRNTDQPDYYYNKTIYIDTKRPDTPTVEAVHTDSIRGEKKDQNQAKELLVSIPTKNTELTNEAREKKDVAENDKNNGVDRAHTAGAETVDKAVDKIGAAIGGLTSMKVTLPNSKTPITLNKKEDGWYIGTTKVEERDGKLVVPVPKGTDLTEANETTNPDKRIKVTVLDKAGNESDPAYANVLNEAPTVAVEKKDLYVYKTKEADKWNNEKVLEKAKPSATDLEDDRDGVDSTKPTIAVSDAGNLDTTKVGDYTVKVQSTDSEGKQSTETNVTVHVLDLIKVDPTVTTDPTNPSTKAPVSPKTADTPVKEGDENLGKYPAGVTREDLVKEVTRTIKYLKEEDANKDNATPLYAEKVQKVTYKRTATVNPETKEVTYSDWEVYKEADKLTDATADGTKGKFNAVESPVVENYLLVNATDKTVAEKEAPVPGEDGTVTPEVTKVLYKEIGSFVPNYPEGKKPNGAQDKIPYPNNLNDPTVPGDFSTITIPYVPGYTPVYNGKELTPKNPNDPTQGYKVPDGFTPTDKFGESPITYTPSTQTAKVVIEKKIDGAANEVVSSFDLTGKSGSELPASTDIDNKIKELKNQGYEVESDEYHTQDNHHPTFDDKEDINAQDGTSAPSQTFKIVVKPRIVEVPSSTPHEKDSPVDPNGENPDLKWPEGLAESDLNTTAKRVISYVKKDSDTATEEKAKDDTVQTVPFTRKATVNLVTKEVTYTDWESTNKTWDKVGVDVLQGYIADKKEIPAKEAATPTKDTKVIPDETDKVTYTKIGSWIPVDPTTGKDGDPIPFPNDPNDPTKTGEITQIIPHKDGYTPKDGNGTPLEPVNPANPAQGYKPPKITDPKANIKITYDKDDQKAKVKFVSVDPKTQTETELTDHALTLTGKSGETISESDVQTHIDVLKSMGYDIVDNPFDKDPVFDTKKDTDDNITQEFTIKVQPRVSTAKTVYVVEGDKPSAEKVGGAVTPGKDGKVTNPDVSTISTDGKAGQEIKVPVTVTYGADKFKRDEPVEVTVKVLPKPAPKGVTVLNGTSNEKLIDAIRENVNKAITGLTNVPEGVTPFITDDAIATPKTDKNGQQTPVTVTVKYRDNATGKVIDDISVNVDVPVNVVGSTPTSKVVFEGDELTAKDITDAVTPGENGTKGEPKDLAKDITAKPGVKEVTVPVTYTDQNGETLTEPVKVKVTVLPKPTPKGIFVAKDSDKEKAKEKALAKAKEAIADGTFKGKLPENVTNVSIDENVDNPDLSDDTDVNVTVKYTVGGEEKTTVVKVPVTVVEGVPQIVPVDENNKQPNPENSIDKTEYPDGSTFEYDPKTPIDTTTPGDYTVNVIVKDKDGNPIEEVPATVRVVESYPQFVPVDKEKKQPSVEGSIDPKAFPKGTEFSYETPVDTTTPGEKDVVVVAKIGDKVIAKIPAKVMVVEPKTQYVPVDKSNKQPDASKSIDPEQYPDGVTFKYKTPVDTTTSGEKDVIVEAKDGEDKLVEVPAKVKVVEGKEQLIPVNPTEKPQARDSITPSDYLEGSTFEYKVPEGQTEPFDATTVGDKPVTVVVKDKNGNVLVEVPATIKVVEAKPTPIETPVTNTPLTKEDIAKYVKVPEGSKVTNVENIPDLTTPGQKNPVKVTVTLPNEKTITVDVPVNVTPVNGIETPVTNTPLTPEDYTKGITIPEGGKVTNVENIPDLTTPGQKDPVKVTVTLPNGKTITVDVPVNVTPVKGIETPVTNTPLTPEDYTKGITIPEGGKVTGVTNIPDLTTPGKKAPVKVTVELPNGKTITVDVPVNVTPATGIETPVTDTPLTKEDIGKHVKVPEGGKIVEVGKIPEVNTPGDKGTVKVKIELPNGKQIEVEVPVKVTPIKDIVKKLGEPITNEDVEKHIQIPEGGKIISIGDKPSTDVPGERPSIPVVIELPGGKRVTVKVPVIVTPKTTPIVVEVGTPITEDMVKKHVDLPEGWKITKVGEIPKTNTPGDKPSVTVELELPDGRKVTVDVPVKVTPKSNHSDNQGNNQGNNGSSTTHIVTRYQDGDGKEISPEENGSHGPKTLEGYEYTGTKTDKNGNVIHTYKKVVTPTRSEQPVSPVRPSNPEKPVVNPTQVSRTESNQAVSETTVENDKKELPNTGTEDKAGLASLGLLGMLSAFGLVARKKKED